MTAAATGQTAPKAAPGTFLPPSFTGKEPAFTPPPPPEAASSSNLAAMREPLPAIPTLPPPGKALEPVPPTAFSKPPAPGASTKEPSLPPFTAPPAPSATKEPAPAPPTPDFLRLPPGGADTNPGSLFAEPTHTREPQPLPRARDEAPAQSARAGGDGSSSGLMFIAAVSTGISALILFLGVYVAVIFKTRLQGLESELKKAQFELSKANVNLSSMMHQVEQLALSAPAAAPKTSLPEWNPAPAKAHAASFKINRSK